MMHWDMPLTGHASPCIPCSSHPLDSTVASYLEESSRTQVADDCEPVRSLSLLLQLYPPWEQRFSVVVPGNADVRGTLQTRPLNRLGEAPDARCARAKSAESDWGTGPETTKGAASLSARVARAQASSLDEESR